MSGLGDDEMEADLATTRSHLHRFQGLSEREAAELALEIGLELRVRRQPGQPMTMDFRPTRVTVDCFDGRVTDAIAG